MKAELGLFAGLPEPLSVRWRIPIVDPICRDEVTTVGRNAGKRHHPSQSYRLVTISSLTDPSYRFANYRFQCTAPTLLAVRSWIVRIFLHYFTISTPFIPAS